MQTEPRLSLLHTNFASFIYLSQLGDTAQRASERNVVVSQPAHTSQQLVRNSTRTRAYNAITVFHKPDNSPINAPVVCHLCATEPTIWGEAPPAIDR